MRSGFTMEVQHKSRYGITEGSIWRNLFLFSVPLVISQILQVLFTIADIAVVGRYSGSVALGAVGSTTILISLFVGFLIGMGSGVNVRVAFHLGEKKDNDVSEAVHTSLVLCTATGIIFLLLCFICARPLLALINTKEELIGGAVLYFRLFALGMPALGIFNFGNGVLSAEGDTRRPLVYLTIAGVVNVGLNLLFVLGFQMSVDGVALASVLSQYLSAVLILIRLFREKGPCKLSIKKMRLYRGKTSKILILGVSAGLQNAIFAVANLFIQSAVNSFDAVTVEGNSAAANSDTVVYNVMAAFYTACSTFMGQNMGAGDKKRTIKSYLVALTYSFGIGLLLGGLLLLFGDEFLYIFTKDPKVVEAGLIRLKVMAVSYAVSAFMDCTIAASRGIGKTVIPTVIVILGSCVFRVIWVYTVFAYFQTILSLFSLYIFSWTLTSIAEIIYFVVCFRKVKFTT